MKKEPILVCPICGTKVEGYYNDCPKCFWGCTGWDDIEEDEDFNRMTVAEAKANYSKGLDKYGAPLNK